MKKITRIVVSCEFNTPMDQDVWGYKIEFFDGVSISGGLGLGCNLTPEQAIEAARRVVRDYTQHSL